MKTTVILLVLLSLFTNEDVKFKQLKTDYSPYLSYNSTRGQLSIISFPVEFEINNNKTNRIQLVSMECNNTRTIISRIWSPNLAIYEKQKDSLLWIRDSPNIDIVLPKEIKKYVVYTQHIIRLDTLFQELFKSYADEMKDSKNYKMELDYKRLNNKQILYLHSLLKGDSIRMKSFDKKEEKYQKIKFSINSNLIIPK